MKTTELQPIYSNVKSFYKKALVFEHEGGVTLQSYDSQIVLFTDGELLFSPYESLYSQTTLRHVREFTQQMTGNAYGIADIRKAIAAKKIF